MQRLAEVTATAYNDQHSHLSLHPRYGPWFALRALLVFDGIEYTGKSFCMHEIFLTAAVKIGPP